MTRDHTPDCRLHGPICWRTTTDGRTVHRAGPGGKTLATYPAATDLAHIAAAQQMTAAIRARVA